MKHAVKVLPLAMALAFVATDARALGLGTLEVKSQLNQPLVAEIPLIGVGPGELEALSVRLAPPEAFDRVGLPRPAGVTANLQFSVGRNARGEPVVRVSTSNRVDDPFVAFLLEADWGKGSVVREFTALIDPPHIAAATVTPMSAPTVPLAPSPPVPAPVAEATPEPPSVVAEPETAAPEALPPEPVPAPPAPTPAPTPVAAEPEPPAMPEPVPAPPAPTPVAVAAEPEPPAMPEPVPAPPVPAASPGSHQVASGETLWRLASANRQGATMAQMMLAIQRANPDAFLRDNINLLRAGAVLRIPTGSEARDLAAAAAEAQVREQMIAWRGGTSAPTPAPADAEPVAALPPAASAQAPVRRGSQTSSRGSGPRLEIAPPAGAGAAGAQSGASSGGSGSELRAELQQVREDLSARDAELRELRSRLSEQEALASEQERLIQLKDSQLSALEETLRRQRTGEADADTVPADTVPADAAPADAAPVDPAPAAVVAEPPAPAAAGESWFRNPLAWGGGGIVLIGGLVALLLRRRKAGTAAPLPGVAAATAPRSRLSDDADFLSNLPPPTAEPVPVPVEPVRAPEPSATPADLDAHVSLLRKHYNAGDVEAFVAAAERMRGLVAKQGDPRWREVVVMGIGLVPGHPLFREVQWNPISGVDVRTRQVEPAPAPAVVPEPAIVPEPASEAFSERETAERPVVDLPPADEPGMDDTRLELAKAYIEIGDADGARGMLEEVLAEGGPAARAEAERLLKQIG